MGAREPDVRLYLTCEVKLSRPCGEHNVLCVLRSRANPGHIHKRKGWKSQTHINVLSEEKILISKVGFAYLFHGDVSVGQNAID